MLRLKMSHHLPRFLTTWIQHFLRDRRACAEVNGVRSHSRPFCAGLSQSSILAPTLFSCSSCGRRTWWQRWTRSGHFRRHGVPVLGRHHRSIAHARDRAQQAGDIITRWARDWNMRLPGSKTQVLVLSQRYKDTRDFHIVVDGAWDNTVRTSFAS